MRVRGDGEIELPRASHRRLLSILALDANRRVGTDVLIDRMWGDEPPATAKAVLQTHVSQLRKLLFAELIVTEGYGYRLDLSEQSFDAEELVALSAHGRQAVRARRWEDALETTEPALALWRGPPYDELRDDDFARPEIARLEALVLELQELRAEALLGLGRPGDALHDLEVLVAEHPLRERLWEHLMTARYRLGRHADALAGYRQAWAALAELGLEPSESLRRLEQKILLHDESVRQAGTPHNLPVELTRFIGRDTELEEVAGLLRQHRLVTLTGVGGSGKTRLAIRVAGGALERFPDGCWFAELAPLRDPAVIPFEVASAIGLRPEGQEILGALTAAIGRDRVLVVLDNCEHLLEGAARAAQQLLEAGPGIRVLVTSREPLRVPGEALFDVPPMSFPEDDHTDATALAAFDAVRLFDERARLARPSFTLAEAGDAVATIVRRLDGIPLAVELAAARVGSMRPEAIAARLSDSLRILTSGSSTGPVRHQTLEAAFAWSYELLDAREQALFCRLSVFRGGFTLEAAEAVCGDRGLQRAEVVPLLTALVDKSLVSTYELAAEDRYRLLETVRAFAASRLAEIEDADVVRRRHLEWCVQVAEDAAARLYGARRTEVMAVLSSEADNLEAALERADALDSSDHAWVLARVLGEHRLELGYVALALELLESALERSTTVEAEVAVRALLAGALFDVGDGDAAYAQAERAYELSSGLDPSPAKLTAATRLAGLHRLLVDRDPARAIPLTQDALVTAEALDDPFARITALRAFGDALAWSGRPDEGLEQLRAAFDLALQTGDRSVVLDAYNQMMSVVFLHPLARRSEPARITEEVLALVPLEEHDRESPAGWIGWILLQSGQWERAERLLDRMGERHLEGYDRTGWFLVRSALRWMQGRLEEAEALLDEIWELGVNLRWYHDYYPLVADIAADGGRLDDVQHAAETYLAVEVDPSEEAKKLGVLNPLARAEVDAALAISGEQRAHYEARARTAVTRGQEILEASPPPSEGSVQMETHRTHLALARAELSRLTGSDPARWHEAVERADFAYFRLYARFRLAEALLEADRADEGIDELRAAHAEAARVGAGRLREQLETLATRAGVSLARRSASPSSIRRASGSRAT